MSSHQFLELILTEALHHSAGHWRRLERLCRGRIGDAPEAGWRKVQCNWYQPERGYANTTTPRWSSSRHCIYIYLYYIIYIYTYKYTVKCLFVIIRKAETILFPSQFFQAAVPRNILRRLGFLQIHISFIPSKALSIIVLYGWVSYDVGIF